MKEFLRQVSKKQKELSVEEAFDYAGTLLDKIEANAREAIALNEINHSAAWDENIFSKFNNTFAAHTLNLVRNKISLSIVLALSRIWDNDKDSECLSIPNLVQLLLRDDRVEAIVYRRRQAYVGDNYANKKYGEQFITSSILFADEAEKEVRELIAKTIDEIYNNMNSKIFASLKALRDRELAHSLMLTRAEKKALNAGTEIEALKINDKEEILKQTIPIIMNLNQCFRDLKLSLNGFDGVWRRYSEDFWKRIAG